MIAQEHTPEEWMNKMARGELKEVKGAVFTLLNGARGVPNQFNGESNTFTPLFNINSKIVRQKQENRLRIASEGLER